ncbi:MULTISPECIES: cell wall-binding protein [Lysinibacillus]|uniref:cell wall-binding protein n=1 Tax=Lysinibacillus TaxID=400634 RepID=UPI0021A8C236|nr:cell wall-binding protein [Lysinibacillus capsici]MCT1539272.1 cell wall-binding protein [Lysinibacillus capsici]MCT1570660.1 cell wall-binding protein [Lysinibacillus capsici]MCT1647432.1 cell wall-binding protein [Lysinibacillus capsici]MCT1726290.1 cell wall-binding protein [Lysinibacillus capsici]MCT1783394.1 cell wall-binding protein [Lysinibacillus capsici]
MVRLNRKLTAGVITGLLLVPTAIANAHAQDNEGQSHISIQSEKVAYANEVAATIAREQLIAQFGKLSENSSDNEMVIADGDITIVQNSADFNADEKAFIQAKYDYVVKQRLLLKKLKEISDKMGTISYTSKTFINDVKNVQSQYETFLGDESTATSYQYVQDQFNQVVLAALNNGAKDIASTVRGTVLQYGYDETARNVYFKGKGMDVDKLSKLKVDVAKVEPVITELDQLVELLEKSTDYSAISPRMNSFTTNYNALTAEQKKVVEAYNPNDDKITPFKKYKDALSGLSALDKVTSSIAQLKGKQPADFTSASSFISAVTAVEKAYNSLDAASKQLLKTEYESIAQYLKAANISKSISGLRVSKEDVYRTTVKDIKAEYDLLTEGKGFVKNIGDLDLALANIAYAEDIEGKIKAINVVEEANKVAAIKAAREAYNNPSGTNINASNVKKIVNNLAELTAWEKNLGAALKVDKLIDSLDPAAKTFESKTLTAWTAFNKLTENDQKLVQGATKLKLFQTYAEASKTINTLKPTTDYGTQLTKLKETVEKLDTTLQGHETALTNLKTQLQNKIDALVKEEEAVQAVTTEIDLLNSNIAIEKILDARAHYNALSSTAKKRVTNIKVLTDLEKSYKSVVNVISLFEKLDSNSKSYISKAKSAYTAYAKLDDKNKTFVQNYKDLKDVIPTIDVMVQISALSPSKKTYKDDVVKAQEAFNKLGESLKAKVVNSQDLTNAQGYINTAKAFDDRIIALANEGPDTFVKKVAELTLEYKAMDKNAQKLVEQAKMLSSYEKDNKAVIKVIQMIDALNPTNKDYTKKVLDARKAYNALDQVSQKRVTNYSNLTAVEDVASLIGLIASLKPTSKTFYQDMKTARELYDSLPAEKQQAIVNYDALVAAENEQGLAQSVVELIKLTEVQDADYLTKLMNARVAYDKLSSDQKKLVTNIKDLTTREKAVKPILSVMVQINELDPESTNFVSKVNSARKAYDKLSKDQKKYIDNINILLKFEPVSNVMELISKLKSSSNTFLQDTSRARSLYDALPDDMKQYVTNYYLLQAAESSILGAGNVMQMIDDLPSVDPKQYVKRIQEIRAAYNALPKDQQRAVQNYKVLQDQEKLIKPVMSIVEDIDRLLTAKDMNSQYQKILKAYDKLNAEQRRYVYNDQLLLSLDNVIKVYNNIAKLNPKDKYYFGMVEAARKEYDSLNTTDKQRISNYALLLEAEKSLADVKKVVEIIAGLSPSSSTYIEDVANAVAAYKALDSKIKGQVINEDVLKQAEKDVAAVLKVVQAIGNIDPDSSSFEKKVLAAQKDYSNLSIEQQGLVYNYRILEDYLKMIQ